MAVRDYRELIAWQKAMDLVELVYRSSAAFPREEMFGLTQQVRKAAVSVPSNIAEGQGRASVRDFQNFLCIARGSLQEMETQILIAERLRYLSTEQHVAPVMALSAEVGRILNGLYNSLTTTDN